MSIGQRRPSAHAKLDYYTRVIDKSSGFLGQPSHTHSLVLHDRNAIRLPCNRDEPIGDLKRYIARKISKDKSKIILRKEEIILEDDKKLSDYDIQNGASLDMHVLLAS